MTKKYKSRVIPRDRFEISKKSVIEVAKMDTNIAYDEDTDVSNINKLWTSQSFEGDLAESLELRKEFHKVQRMVECANLSWYGDTKTKEILDSGSLQD